MNMTRAVVCLLPLVSVAWLGCTKDSETPVEEAGPGPEGGKFDQVGNADPCDSDWYKAAGCACGVGVLDSICALDALDAMSAEELKGLYERARTPEMGDLVGDMRGRVVETFIQLENDTELAELAELVENGQNPWLGKAFWPYSEDAGFGINRIVVDVESRLFEFETSIQPSRAGDFDSFHLNYDLDDNLDVIRRIKDEIRQVAPGVWLGGAYDAPPGGETRLALYFALADFGQRGGPQYERFASFDPTTACDGLNGYFPPEYFESLGKRHSFTGSFTPAEIAGLCTWHLFTGEGGRFFQDAVKKTKNVVNILRLADTKYGISREDRFAKLGAINRPGCRKAEAPDQFGLSLDVCDDDPYSTGIIGARLEPNPKFDMAEWTAKGGAEAYYAKDPSMEPPYLVTVTCTSCHIGFDPTNPPDDVHNPKWEHLHPTIANQYLREGTFFGATFEKLDGTNYETGLENDNFVWHVLVNQQPGTSDTSRITSDHINNPNTINRIFNLAARPMSDQTMNDNVVEAADGRLEKQATVHSILKDGADSVGAEMASLRVFVNIGLCSNYLSTRLDSFLGRYPQKPVDIVKMRDRCQAFRDGQKRMGDMIAALAAFKPTRLQDAPGGDAYIDDSKLVEGQRVFVQECASCHNSKPDTPPADATEVDTAWIEGNFFADGVWYSVDLLGTNSQRAFARNATQGRLWQNFSSETYKARPAVGPLSFDNPDNEKQPYTFDPPGDGRGYYRTPPLFALWSSAPFLHNNSLGLYNADPTVAGRLEAFQDAAEKLLGLKSRDRVVKRTDRDTELHVGPLSLAVPAGTPTNLVANLDLWRIMADVMAAIESGDPGDLPEALIHAFQAARQEVRQARQEGRAPSLEAIPFSMVADLLVLYNQVPDFIEDKGHDFGQDLTDDEKRALIEFLKFI